MPHTTQQQPKHPQQTQPHKPQATQRATVFIHPLDPQEGPLSLTLPAPVVRLLRTLDLLQRRQAGEDIAPTSDDAPALAALDKLSPGEVEASIAGGVAQVLECLWSRGEEVVRITAQEKWALLKVRALSAADTERMAPDARQVELAAQLERLMYGRKTLAEVKIGKEERSCS